MSYRDFRQTLCVILITEDYSSGNGLRNATCLDTEPLLTANAPAVSRHFHWGISQRGDDMLSTMRNRFAIDFDAAFEPWSDLRREIDRLFYSAFSRVRPVGVTNGMEWTRDLRFACP